MDEQYDSHQAHDTQAQPPTASAAGVGTGTHTARPMDSVTGRLPRWSRRHQFTLASAAAASGALLLVLLLRLVDASHAAGDPISPLAGHPAPDFTISTWTWDGAPSRTVHLAALRGHPVVVNFWASWCDACREEEPTLEAAYQRYQAQGAVFIGVAFQDTQHDGTAFLRQYNVTFPSGPDTGEIATNYGLTGIPETVFINTHGIVVQKWIGAVNDGNRDLNAAVQALLR